MESKPMFEIWIDRAMDSYLKGDFESAEIRLTISNHLNPTAHAKTLLSMVRKKKIQNEYKTHADTGKDRRTDAEECLLIAKIAIERQNLDEAKKFIILAEKSCPIYYSNKLYKKIRDIERWRARQQSKKVYVDKLFENAKLECDCGNFSKAEKLLLKAQKTYSTIRAQELLKQVQNSLKFERELRSENPPAWKTRFYIIAMNVLNILTCSYLERWGYVRFEDEDDFRSQFFNQRNSRNRTQNGANFGRNPRTNRPADPETDEEFNCRFGESDQHFFNTFKRNTGNERNNENSSNFKKNNNSKPFTSQNAKTKPEYAFNSESTKEQGKNNSGGSSNTQQNPGEHDRKRYQYSYTSQNIPGSARENPGRSSNNEGHFGENQRERDKYSYNSQNMPGHSRENPGRSTNNEGNPRGNDRERYQYSYTSQNIPGSAREHPGKSTHNEQNAGENDRERYQYAYSSQNMPGHSRENPGRSTNNERNSGENDRQRYQYAYSSQNMPGCSKENPGRSSNNEGNSGGNDRERYQYSYSSQNMPGWSRENPGRSTSNEQNSGENQRQRYQYAYNSQNMPGWSGENPGRSTNNEGNSGGQDKQKNQYSDNSQKPGSARENPGKSTNNGQNSNDGSRKSHQNGSQNMPKDSNTNKHSNTSSSNGDRNSKNSSSNSNKNNTKSSSKSKSGSSKRSGEESSWRRFFRRPDYTPGQAEAVNRVFLCKNNYEKLGLPFDCTESDVVAAYKRMALFIHPDKNKAPRAGEAFVIIKAAKDSLLQGFKAK